MKTFLSYTPCCRVFAVLIACIFSFGCTHSSNAEQKTTAPVNEYTVEKNVVWAAPNGQNLAMDIYTPKTGKASYPVLVIFHGGGWLINNKSIMDSMAVYMVQHGEYVVCNVDYRLLGDANNSVTMNQMIEDALGAVAWIKTNIAKYGGNALKIVVTGDSAGGHLAAMVLFACRQLETDGFAGSSLGYNPTFLPPGKTAEDLLREKYLDVQGAILSYPALDILGNCMGGFETSSNFFWMMAGKTPRGIFGDSVTLSQRPDYYRTVSPVYIIPQAVSQTLPPQLCLVGSLDNMTTPASVESYVTLCRKAGQNVEYWVHTGRPHAFLDSGSNAYLGTAFYKDAPPALNKMLEFLNKLFY